MSREFLKSDSIEEYFDVLNEDGSPAGFSKPRKVIHAQGYFHRSVHVWVLNREKSEVLLQLRSRKKDSHPSLWDTSCAGHLSAGETSLDAVENELREELGIDLKSLETQYSLEFLASLKRHYVLNNGSFIDNEWTDIYVFESSHSSVSLVELKHRLEKNSLDGEVEDVKFEDIHTLLKNLNENHPNYVPCFNLAEYTKAVFLPLIQRCKSSIEIQQLSK